VHPDLKTVIELHRLDSRIAELTAQIDALPAEIQTLEAQLHEFIHAHEERRTRLNANLEERKALEMDIKVIQERITKHKDQLYQVKTNEQYRAMLREIEGEEAKIRQIEDQLLEKMLEAEQLEKQIQDAASRLDSEKSRVAADVKRLQTLRQADEAERDRLQAHRKQDEAALSAEVLDLYERVRKARRGVALAEARDGSCTACNVRLRPQVYNEVRTGESIVTCESCGRILYYVEPGRRDAADAEGFAESGEQSAVPD
jgi:predicted  nucleic acid-binding Zn-ribbon protein